METSSVGTLIDPEETTQNRRKGPRCLSWSDFFFSNTVTQKKSQVGASSVTKGRTEDEKLNKALHIYIDTVWAHVLFWVFLAVLTVGTRVSHGSVFSGRDW